ncbi:MAG: hypothetical protein KJO33_10685 [Gammaproteobacteria bacterium]|nr:hypothetical protein [Gammaproteobacteria bacterium]MBT8064201.1 hypothetical protein [Gammaproteobacteria bacterium]NNK33376.1 hypothetical protein [Xanthomonadales bacterium]
MHRIIWLLIVLLCPAAAAAQAVPYAEPEPEKQVHWATAAFFGTGWYQVDENRSVFIFRIPPRQTVRRAGWTEDGKRQLGIEIQYPLALGLHTLDDIPDFIEFDNYGTLTFTPGVQVEIPINRDWHLRPYAHLGFGYERESGEWAGIWYGGVKSRYRLGETEKFRWSLLNAIYYAGYKPEFENRGRYASAMAGLEFNQPLGRFRIDGEPAWLNWHVTYNYLFDRLNFHVDEDRVESIEDQWELGLALGRGSKGIKLWFLTFEHIGLAYRFSSDGRYRAITVNFRSPFTY